MGAVDVARAQLSDEDLKAFRARVKLAFLLFQVDMDVGDGARYVKRPLPSHENINTRATRLCDHLPVLLKNAIDVATDEVVAQIVGLWIGAGNLRAQDVTVDAGNKRDAQSFF